MLKNYRKCVTARVTETDLTSKLTAAEKRVLTLVSTGETNKGIAAALGISPATVKHQLENVLRKLALKNRVEAAIYGLIVNGCPNGSSSPCPLALWRKAKLDAQRNRPFDP